MAPPINDNFASAEVISGSSGTTTGTVLDATKEATESTTLNGGSTARSVWYKFTAPASGWFKFALEDITYVGGGSPSSLSGALYVFNNGVLTAHTETSSIAKCVTQHADPYETATAVNMTSGNIYYIRVNTTSNTAAFSFTLAWDQISAIAPSNDLFANRIDLGSIPISETGISVLDSIIETGEAINYTNFTGEQSIWYKFTPASTGKYALRIPQTSIAYEGTYLGTKSSDDRTYIQIGTGASASAFSELAEFYVTPVDTRDKRLYIDLTSGTEYIIRVSGAFILKTSVEQRGYNSIPSTFDLEIDLAPSAPANDDFANAEIISGTSGSTSGTTLQATKESTEPSISGDDQSVWYKYTATQTGMYVFNIPYTSMEYLGDQTTGGLNLAVFNETVDDVSEATRSNELPTGFSEDFGSPDFGGTDATVKLQLYSGNTYYIKVWSASGTGPVSNDNVVSFDFEWNFITGPTNDLFANSVSFGSAPDDLTGYTTKDASVEDGEANEFGFAQDQSVWFDFTPSSTGRYRFNLHNVSSNSDSTTRDMGIALYTGSTVSSLTLLIKEITSDNTASKLPIRWDLTSGIKYYIKVFTTNLDYNNMRTFDFDIELQEIDTSGSPPANDNIDAPEDLGLNPSGTYPGSTVYATSEVWDYGEPSVWYKFSIDFTGKQTVLLDKTGADPDWEPYGEIYKVLNDPPSDFDDLEFYDYLGQDVTPPGGIASTDIDWVPGDYYLTVLDWNFDGTWDDFNLVFQPYYPPPVNDNFPNRIILQKSYRVSTTGITAGASSESGEPTDNPGGVGPYPSVWYAWTAPNTNNTPLDFQIDTLGSSAETYLEVFTGSNINSLTRIVSDHNSGAGGKSQLTLSAVGDTTYVIRVASPDASVGTFNLNIAAQVGGTPPANDDFANAELMTGYSDSASGTTVGATSEVGEQTWDGQWDEGEQDTTNSVWYKWVPPQTGRVRVGFTADSGLSLYMARGTALETLQEIKYFSVGSVGAATENYDYVTVEGGIDYYFIIQGNGGTEETFTFSFYMENVPIPANDNPATPTIVPAVNGSVTVTDTTQGIYFDNIGIMTGDFVTDATAESSMWYKFTPDRFGKIIIHVNDEIIYNDDFSSWDASINILKGNNIENLTYVGGSTHLGALDSSAMLEPGETYWIMIGAYAWATTFSWTYTIQLQDSRVDGIAPDPNNGTSDFDSVTGGFVADGIDGVFVASGGVGYGTIEFSDGHWPIGWWTRFEVDSTSGDYLYRYGQTQQYIEIFRATREDDTYESVCVLGHNTGIQTIAYYQNGTLRYDTEHAVWGAHSLGSSSKVRIEAGANGLTIDGVNFFFPRTEGFKDTIDNQFKKFDFGIITYPGDGSSYVDLDPEWNIRLSDVKLHDNPSIGVMGPADENNKEITSFYGWTTGDLIRHDTSDYQFNVTGNLFGEGTPVVDVSAGEYSNGYSIIMDVPDALHQKYAYFNMSQPTDALLYDPYGDPAVDTYFPGFSFRFYIHDNFPSTTAKIAWNLGSDDVGAQGWILYVGNDGTLYIQPSQNSGLIPFCHVNINEWTYIEIQWDCHIRPYACKIWMQNSVYIGRFEESGIFNPVNMDPNPAYLAQYGLGTNQTMKIEYRDAATTRCKQHRPLGPTTVIGRKINGTGEHLYPEHIEGTKPTQTPFSFNGDFAGGTDGAGQPHYWTGYDRYDTGVPAGAMRLDYIFSQFPTSFVSLTTDGSGPPGLESANAMQVVAASNGATAAYVFGGGTSPATDVVFPYQYADTISLHFWLKGIAGHGMHIAAESGIGGWVPNNYHTMSGDWEYVRLFLEPQNFSGFTHNLTGLYVVFDSSTPGDTYLIKDAWFYLNADNNFLTFWQTSDNGTTVTEVPFDDEDSWQLIDEFPPTIRGDHIYAATDIFRDTVRGAENDGKTHLPPAMLPSYLEYTFNEYNPPDGEKIFAAKLLTQSKDFSGPDQSENVNWKSYGNAGKTYITIANEDGEYRSIGGRKAATHINDPDERRFGTTLRRPPGLREWTIDKWNSFRIRFGHHHDLFGNSSHIIEDYTNAGVLEGAYAELLVYDRRLPPPNCVRPIDLSRIRFRAYQGGDV